MLEFDVFQKKVVGLLKNYFRQENLSQCHVVVTGKAEKGDSNAAAVNFVKIKTNYGSELNLVVKINAKSETIRKILDPAAIYLRESKLYNEIFPSFAEFQLRKCVRKPFNATAKFYGGSLTKGEEMLIIENVTLKGFKMHDRQKPLNRHHIKIVLKNLAKFHAISLAMKDQKRAYFDTLTENFSCMHKFTFLHPLMDIWYENRLASLINVLKEEDPSLINRVENLVAIGSRQGREEIIYPQLEEKVITHGDCWNSNFMFKYKSHREKIPEAVMILDWQLSCLHSPVLDLSNFLYSVASEENLLKIDQFLNFYHRHLTTSIKELGSDPGKLFPYSTLIKHWNKCSVYGVIFTINALEMLMCDKNDAVDFDEMAGNEMETVQKWLGSIKAKNAKNYRKRMVGVIRAYLKNCKY